MENVKKVDKETPFDKEINERIWQTIREREKIIETAPKWVSYEEFLKELEEI